MDPNVQVAAIGVFATMITTFGLVAVAVINNRKERTKAAAGGVEAGLDERSVLGLIFSLMSENDRSQEEILKLKAELATALAENNLLRMGAAAKERDSP